MSATKQSLMQSRFGFTSNGQGELENDAAIQKALELSNSSSSVSNSNLDDSSISVSVLGVDSHQMRKRMPEGLLELREPQ